MTADQRSALTEQFDKASRIAAAEPSAALLGGIGLMVARWLVDSGAGRVVLNSRSEPSVTGSSEVAPNAIPVVGMAARFPGANTLSAFWDNLCRGEESIVTLSEGDLLAEGIGEKALADHAYVRRAALLDGVKEFDADFFGFAPQAARMTDPQHRLFLQSAWHALEFTGFLSRLTLREPQIPATWAREVRSTVRFSDEVDVLLADPHRILVEVGPGGSSTGSAMRHPRWSSGHRAVRLMRHHAQNRDVATPSCWRSGNCGQRATKRSPTTTPTPPTTNSPSSTCRRLMYRHSLVIAFANRQGV